MDLLKKLTDLSEIMIDTQGQEVVAININDAIDLIKREMRCEAIAFYRWARRKRKKSKKLAPTIYNEYKHPKL